MLKHRVVTGLLLAFGAVASIYFLSSIWFALFFALIAALGAAEWAALLGWPSGLARNVYVAVYLLLLAGLYQSPALRELWLYGCVGLWLGAVLSVLTYPNGQSLYRQRWLMAPLGLALLAGAWCGLLAIRALPDGAYWLIWVLALVALADVGAYFAGRRFGRHHLAPRVSPGKTWEGALGGLLLSMLVCGSIVGLWQGAAAHWLVIIPALVALSVFGDLFESVLKRATGIKDSGQLLPGHGGVLDRIDAIIAVVPVFAAGWSFQLLPV